LLLERKDGHRAAKHPGDHWLQDVLAQRAGQQPGVEVTPDDVCVFQFTGGTTGTPKAAVCTHRALVANTTQCHAWVSPERAVGEHNFIAALPLFHVYGLISVLTFGASFRAALVMFPEPREIVEIMACIDYYRCDAFMGVPAFYNAIVSHPAARKYNLTSVNACISGAAPLSPETKARFEALTGGVLVEGYGMSETPSVTHINPIEGENRVGSIGLPVPDVECRVVSLEDSETDVPVGEPGELIVRGPQLMNHYYNMPTETADAMRAGSDGAPWLYTGDVVRMDEDGFFYIVDRKKDVVIIGGFTVYPTLVERVLSELPQIADVAVAGIPHPDPVKVGQEALKAWVVLKAGQSLTEKAMIAHASTKLAPYEVPYRYAFVDSLPKTIVGKTLRRELVHMVVEAREGQ
jgi:long-chain acyl-CoA synthetase